MLRRVKLFFAVAAPLCICVYTVTGAGSRLYTEPVVNDAAELLSLALNLHNHGVFSVNNTDRVPTPSAAREPGYPAVLAFGAALLLDRGELSSKQAIHSSSSRVQTAVYKLKYINVALLLFLSIFSSLVVYCFTGSYWLSLLALLCVGSSSALVESSNRFLSEIFTALLVVLSGFCLGRAWVRPGRLLFFFFAGVAFALLVLTKAVFFYLAPALALLCFVRCARCLHWRGAMRAAMVFFLGYALLVLPWMIRNQYHFKRLFICERGGVVLSIRAAYNAMTPREYAAGFLVWTPSTAVQPLLSRYFRPQDYCMLDRSNPEGYYRRVKRRQAMLAERYESSVKADREMLATAWKQILRSPLRHVLMTAPFAYRGIFVARRINLYGDICLLPGTLLSLGLFICFCTAASVSVLNRQYGLLGFLTPAAFSFAFYAFCTHNIPRYSLSLLPVFWITALIVVHRYGGRLLMKRIARPKAHTSLPDRTIHGAS